MNLTSAAAETARPASAAAASSLLTARLFRASLAQGRLHPLYLPMLSYRSARPEASAGSS